MSHNCKELDDLLAEVLGEGFRLEDAKGGAKKLYAPVKEAGFYTIHPGERAYHPVRRFINKAKKYAKPTKAGKKN